MLFCITFNSLYVQLSRLFPCWKVDGAHTHTVFKNSSDNIYLSTVYISDLWFAIFPAPIESVHHIYSTKYFNALLCGSWGQYPVESIFQVLRYYHILYITHRSRTSSCMICKTYNIAIILPPKHIYLYITHF